MDSPTLQTSPEPRRRGRGVKRWLTALLALVLLLAAAGYGLHRHFNNNLTSIELPQGIGGGEALQGLPKGVAQNIVVIGTDQRQSAENCRLGGSCGDDKLDGDNNADVLMLVHLSADHESLSVVSIPRDTVIDLPDCRATSTPSPSGQEEAQTGGRGRINGTLNNGVECTLRAVHELTGLPITHFMMVDFAGVISLSDAVGGVDVCVDADVYDTYSHLKLKQGDHTLQGEAALQFLRTRHGFGDGSDLGRTGAQHLYLSSLQRELESLGTLLNPTKVYRLAQAGTKALTVDSGLDDVRHLASLGMTLGGVSTEATAFVTLPTEQNPDNPNTVVPAPQAEALFRKLAQDAPLATPSPSPSASSANSASSASPSASSSPAASRSAQATPSEPQASDSGSPMVSAEAKQCAKVSTQQTVEIKGVPMTPTEAYAASPQIPDSTS